MDIFDFLKDESNRAVLTWIGTGIVAVATGIWAVVKFKAKANGAPKPHSISISADHGGMAAGRDNISINALGSSKRPLLELEIEYQREVNGQLTTFNRRLSSLRISPIGIVKMLDDLKAEPSKKRRDALWPSIKTKAETTQSELEHLYSMMNTMDRIYLFGKDPHILDDVGRVVKLKTDGLYSTMRSLPSDKSPDAATIQSLVEHAHALKPLNEEVEAIQHKIADYLGKNEEYVRDLVRSPGSPVKIVLVNGQ